MNKHTINITYIIPELPPYCGIYKDLKTGIVTIHNGRTGNSHSCHANIDGTGSIRGMKKLGYWRKKDRCIKSNGTIYNIDTFVVPDKLDEITAGHCVCPACRERRKEVTQGAKSMKLLTKEIEKNLPALNSQDGKPADNVPVIVKFFAPWNNWTWYATEGEYCEEAGTWVFFGLVKGLETELGYFTLAELEGVEGPYRMRIERDRNFTATLAEVTEGKRF